MGGELKQAKGRRKEGKSNEGGQSGRKEKFNTSKWRIKGGQVPTAGKRSEDV